jgi:hypothetical protein
MLNGSMMNRGTLIKLVTSMPIYLLSLLGWNSTFLTCTETKMYAVSPLAQWAFDSTASDQNKQWPCLC